MSSSRRLRRLLPEEGPRDLAAHLAQDVKPSELTSLLLDVARRRVTRRTPADVLAEYERDRFSRPARLSPVQLARFELLAFEHLSAAFEPITLAPVTPLGTASVVAGVSQDWAVATTRGFEVVSDATNVLALEAASRRRALGPRSPQGVHLAAHHRLLRPQFFHGPRQTAHFALLALVSAARAGRGSSVELELVALHVRAHLAVIRAVTSVDVPLRVVLSDFSARDRADAVRAEVIAPLSEAFEGVTFEVNAERQRGRGYYAGLAFEVYGRADDEDVFLVDGGEVQWVARLLSNEKERTVISGLGSERLCSVFGRDER
ncbi:hypothetical protein [Deinococcus yavapaiensis]|uniref:Uncharacterized protein n=1 Tax=Deinococcus yavapaiensis KR-236 TaxID=694435 RepID=A0A318SA51_9DEIO|nr:hypothetical protein [Deinococcus yavapaiensis]PYE54050.1 hypothetical protein DES52_10612 [Deinococcus yavapaiensis KR-236]